MTRVTGSVKVTWRGIFNSQFAGEKYQATYLLLTAISALATTGLSVFNPYKQVFPQPGTLSLYCLSLWSTFNKLLVTNLIFQQN